MELKLKASNKNNKTTDDELERDINPENMSRKNCHTDLKEYIQSKRSNKYTKDKDKMKPGPFFIKDIPFKIRLSGMNNGYFFKPKRKYQQKIRKSWRLKQKAKGKKSNNSIFKIKCNHVGKCFMNIKRI